VVAVTTVGEVCKKCYSCVRTCPTKAIEVHSGQAQIVEERCVSCGFCVSACSQGAKRVRSSVAEVDGLLRSRRTVALVAPSFPAAYLDLEPGQVVAALRAAGFAGVYEVAAGADLVSAEYRRLFDTLDRKDPAQFLIASPCPAVVSYVEKIHPELVGHLAPVMSPMEATAKLVREQLDPGARAVFIGPCVAKKDEIQRLGLVEEVLTFLELEDLWRSRDVRPSSLPSVDFDKPHANLGRLYPVTGGLLKAAGIGADLLESPVYVVEGKERVADILAVLSSRKRSGKPVVNKLFDLLFCEGCIAGPAFPNQLTFYERRRFIVDYVRSRPSPPAERPPAYPAVNLAKTFGPRAVVEPVPTEDEIRAILAKTNKNGPQDELNCRACGYRSCRDKAIAVHRGLAEVEMCLPYLISRLETSIQDLQHNQHRLIQAEKLASMGQMAAGIAHEINNPLGVVLMYSHLLKDELESTSRAAGDAAKIIAEAERTRTIVRGILNFARQEKLDRVATDINALVRSAVDGLRLLDPEGTLRVVLDLQANLSPRDVDPAQLRQVLDNVLKNAAEVMPGGGTVTVQTRGGEGEFVVTIRDTGPGIPVENLDRIFVPFYTTKPVGKGTGLGLPVCYGIVKMHGGSITAGNNPDGGAWFEIKIRSDMGGATGAYPDVGKGNGIVQRTDRG
jgi:signal transduction histidine kinase/Fe-S-cluster-containing hydrogenase component 2